MSHELEVTKEKLPVGNQKSELNLNSRVPTLYLISKRKQFQVSPNNVLIDLRHLFIPKTLLKVITIMKIIIIQKVITVIVAIMIIIKVLLMIIVIKVMTEIMLYSFKLF